MKNGFSIVEILVVVAIISLLSVGAVLSFSGFQHQTIMEKSVSELTATIRNARAKSIAGELPAGTPVEGYPDEGRDTSKLPVWAIRFSNTPGTCAGFGYEILSTIDRITYTSMLPVAEIHCVDKSLTLTTSSSIPFFLVFDRGTGFTPSGYITLKRGSSEGKKVNVRSNGTFSIQSV